VIGNNPYFYHTMLVKAPLIPGAFFYSPAAHPPLYKQVPQPHINKQKGEG